MGDESGAKWDYEGRVVEHMAALDAEVALLRKGLQQIVDGDHPAAFESEWAADVLADPTIVNWHEED